MSRSVALLWGFTAALLIAASPWAAPLIDSLWSCAFKSWTGVPCPTCGTARAALALASFDIGGALRRYPLPAVGWMFFLGGGLAAAGMSLLGRTPPAIPSRLPSWTRLALGLAVLANWMYSIATGV